MMTAAVTISWILVLLSLSHAQIVPGPEPPKLKPPERDVNAICDTVRCGYRTFCRVIQTCYHREGCVPHAVCLPCVPHSVDELCNSRNYINTVIEWKSRQLSLIPLYCNPKLPNDVSGCPSGSVCTPNQGLDFVGACCYGKPDPPLPVHSLINNDRRCAISDECPYNCWKGYECKGTISDCGITKYVCQPIVKEGRCRRVRNAGRGRCVKSRLVRYCEIDADCEGDKKCCRDACNGMSCLPPVTCS